MFTVLALPWVVGCGSFPAGLFGRNQISAPQAKEALTKSLRHIILMGHLNLHTYAYVHRHHTRCVPFPGDRKEPCPYPTSPRANYFSPQKVQLFSSFSRVPARSLRVLRRCSTLFGLEFNEHSCLLGVPSVEQGLVLFPSAIQHAVSRLVLCMHALYT